MRTQLALLLTAAVAALVFAAAADAHVTLHPNALPSGGFQVINVRVPNERSAATTKVDVKFPGGFLFLSYQRVPGWTARVLYRKLKTPVTVFGQKFTQEVDRVVWRGRLPAGQFVELPLSVAMPNGKPGTVLTFKALQTYANGEVVRWIGNQSAEAPAPQVLLTNANAAVQDFPAGIAAAKKARRSSRNLYGIALGVPIAGLALLLARRRSRA